MEIKGKVFKYGDDINTDVIFPGKYTYTVNDPQEMAKHALEDLDPDFINNVEKNDIIVAGKNFGCGSSREQAVFCLKYAGIGAIIAKSFARIYYRNAINGGLPIIQSPEAVEALEAGEKISVDLENGVVKTEKGQEFKFNPLPDFIMEIINEDGLVNYTRKKLGIKNQ